MRWRLKDGVALLTLLLCAWQAHGLEATLEYYRFPDNSGERVAGSPESFAYGYARVEQSKEAPPGEWTLPELKSTQPLYVEVPLGDKKHLMIIDAASEGAAFYDRIYFDANANRDLTDDPPIKKEAGNSDASNNFVSASFERIDAEIVVNGKKMPYSFQSFIYCFFANPKDQSLESENNWQNLHLQLRLACAYRGTFSLGGTEYQVVLGDSNVNGRFDDTLSTENAARYSTGAVYPQGDRIYLSSGETMDYYTGMLLCRRLYTKGTLYSLKVENGGTRLQIEATEDALSSLSLPEGISQLVLEGAQDGNSVLAFEPGGTVRVPADSYRLVSYQIHRTGAKKDRWRIMAAGGEDQEAISVAAGEEKPLPMGEPFVPEVAVARYQRDSLRQGQEMDSVQLEFLIKGAGKEIVTDLTRVSGDKSDIEMSTESATRPKEPTYRIVQSDGEMVAQGSFRYG